MAILTSAIWTSLLGGVVVVQTSPTFDPEVLQQQHWALVAHAIIIDVLLAFLVSYIILCHIEDKWIAQEGSFPYTCQIPWNFGPKAFDFQLLVFELFHVNWFSRNVHLLTIAIQTAAWFYIIGATFSWVGMVPLLVLLIAQAASFGDIFLGIFLTLIHMGMVAGVACARHYLPSVWLDRDIFVVKTILFWALTVQTLCHVVDRLPPTYDEHLASFDDNFGDLGWKMLVSNPFKALWLFCLGQVSELGAALPGRLFCHAAYKFMFKLGYRSKVLENVADIKRQGLIVVEHGWQAHETTREMYSWAKRAQKTTPSEASTERKVEIC